jgi:molecular chaperone IbpA
MRPYDFSPLWRSTVGFDRMFELINSQVPNIQDSYPPYDITRTGDESYRISIALAGFTPEQITVTAQQNRLTVAGQKNHENRDNYIFQSIANRAFERHFSLADHVEVEGGTFENGLLQVDLVRRVPESMKPRRIEISVGQEAPRNAKALNTQDVHARPIKAA